MTLDLEELLAGWDCPVGELRARVIVGRDGRELVQLRVDLGVMQMFSDGRPDGQCYRGMPSARAYIEHELRLDHRPQPDDLDELERELTQTNYRRMALSAAAEAALHAAKSEDARRYILGALRDVDECLTDLRIMAKAGRPASCPATLRTTLVFDQARLAAQLRIIEARFEEAVEQAERGAAALEELLTELGLDEAERAEDAGLSYLRRLARQLRREYGIAATLREQLADAVAREDFESAAELRDELARRECREKGPQSDG